MNKSEEFVLKLCQRTFLSLWSVPNPQGKEPGKELCDILVVCDPDIIIFSVKEIEYKETEDVGTGWSRWTKRAIDKSVKQIYGAERILAMLERITHYDGTEGLFLPDHDSRNVHRVAVALGSKGEVPMTAGEFGKGFVHVFDEHSIEIVLRELDTIGDFIEYLTAVEELLVDREVKVVAAGEENLLAWYIHNGRAFPEGFDAVLVGDDLWHGLSAKEEFKAKKEADQDSYFWDQLIEYLVQEHDPDLTVHKGTLDNPNPGIEQVVRILAREDRFSRRILSKAFKEFHTDETARSRIVRSNSGVVYVFLTCPHGYPRQARNAELFGRMFVARGLNQDAQLMVGIATENYDPSEGFTFDVAALHKPTWTEEDEREMRKLQEATGAFVAPRETPFSEDEYPQSGVSETTGTAHNIAFPLRLLRSLALRALRALRDMLRR